MKATDDLSVVLTISCIYDSSVLTLEELWSLIIISPTLLQNLKIPLQ